MCVCVCVYDTGGNGSTGGSGGVWRGEGVERERGKKSQEEGLNIGEWAKIPSYDLLCVACV